MDAENVHQQGARSVHLDAKCIEVKANSGYFSLGRFVYGVYASCVHNLHHCRHSEAG